MYAPSQFENVGTAAFVVVVVAGVPATAGGGASPAVDRRLHLVRAVQQSGEPGVRRGDPYAPGAPASAGLHGGLGLLQGRDGVPERRPEGVPLLDGDGDKARCRCRPRRRRTVPSRAAAVDVIVPEEQKVAPAGEEAGLQVGDVRVP